MSMIPFEEIDARLENLGKDRLWLTKNTPYSAAYLRDVMAVNSTRRSVRVLKVISDAIEREESLCAARMLPEPLGHRVYLEPTSAQFDTWMAAAHAVPGRNFALWVSKGLDAIAARELSLASFAAASSIESIPSPGVHWIDLCGGIAAGSPISSDVPSAPIQVAKPYPPDHYALQVFGRSMEPKIPDGSLVVVQHLAEGVIPKQGSIVVYSDAYGLAIKQISYRKARADEIPNAFGKVAVLKSINPEFPEIQTIDGGRLEAVFVEVLAAA